MKKYQNNGHIIYRGDAIEILQSEVRDASIDLIFTDPPYNIGKTFSDFEDRWSTDAAYAECAHKWIDEYLIPASNLIPQAAA